jgi:pimeloyl-ACP methyl ester carboxylesterase
MRNQNDIKKERSPTRRGRGCLVWLGGILAVLLILILAGWIYEPLAEAADAKAFPPPGKLVDVDGYRLHINCSGSGSPTVVIESGWGDMSASWGWVQPEVAKTTRICTYDRAGMGWSESSPQPRTAQEFAKELHTLLAKANEPGPYVLVGHSLGGYTVRVYAQDYPQEVAGVVFVDPQNLPVSETAAPTPAPKPGQTSLPALMARFGLARLLAGPLGSYENLPEGDKQAYTAYAVTSRGAQTLTDELTGMSEGAAQARAVTTLGAMPLIVLSRGKDMDGDSAASQARYLALSTISQHLIAENSGHSIMIEKPEAAVSAILKMVEQVRK